MSNVESTREFLDLVHRLSQAKLNEISVGDFSRLLLGLSKHASALLLALEHIASGEKRELLPGVLFPPNFEPDDSLELVIGPASSRVKNTLRSLEIKTFRDLFTEGTKKVSCLRIQPDFGVKSLNQFRSCLEAAGFRPDDFLCLRHRR